MKLKNLGKMAALSLITLGAANVSYGYGTQNVSFEDVKLACQDPGRFHNQNPPSQIRIRCTDIENVWERGPEREVTLETARELSNALISNKFVVDESAKPIGTPEDVFACPTFRQVQRELSFERQSSCSEILQYDSLHDFCLAASNEVQQENPDVVVERETGVIVNSCETEFEQGEVGQDDPTQDETGQDDYGQDYGQDWL